MLAFLLALGACGDSAPRQQSLLQVMYRIDFEDQALRAALGRGDLGQARASGTRLRAYLAEAAFASYLERPGLPAPAARFAESQQSFTVALDQLLAALDGGDAPGATQLYARMRMTCEICHRDFRPGL